MGSIVGSIVESIGGSIVESIGGSILGSILGSIGMSALNNSVTSSHGGMFCRFVCESKVLSSMGF